MWRRARLLISLVVVASVGLHAGCRCEGPPSEGALPHSRTPPGASRAVRSISSCPPRPAWAGLLARDVEIELLHTSGRPKSLHGVGYRLHQDGVFETYDDITAVSDARGRTVLRRVEGKWRRRGKVHRESLEALRRLVSTLASSSLKGRWRTRGSRTMRTHLMTRREGRRLDLCYIGSEAPLAIEALQDRIHDLVNHIGTSEQH